MLKATVIQQLLGVDDFERIAYGYTLDRLTVTVWFENGKVCRSDVPATERLSEAQYEECVKRLDNFDAHTLLHANIKRWYADKTHPALREWCETFGLPLCETGRGG